MLSTINTYLEDDGESSNVTSTTIYHQISKGTLWIMFVLQNAFVQLLYTQHWSFLGSIQTSEEAAVRFAPIAGVGSIISTIAACLVSPLVERIGLTGLLYCAALGLAISAVCADWAYNLSEKHGFEPTGKDDAKGNSTNSSSEAHSASFISRARILFRRVPILGAICVEELSYHGLSSVVNFLFMAQAKLSIVDDKSRAGWTGYSYAMINGASGVMQFLVIPLAVKYIDPKHIFMINPTVMLVCTLLLLKRIASPIYVTTATLVVLKTMEYSLRGLAHELLYVTLDYESRFVGKEIIGVVANRIGKSGMAVLLSLLSMKFGSNSDNLHYLAFVAVTFSAVWLAYSVRLYRNLGQSEKDKHD